MINYCNEKLQQVFIQMTLKEEQEEYEREVRRAYPHIHSQKLLLGTRQICPFPPSRFPLTCPQMGTQRTKSFPCTGEHSSITKKPWFLLSVAQSPCSCPRPRKEGQTDGRGCVGRPHEGEVTAVRGLRRAVNQTEKGHFSWPHHPTTSFLVLFSNVSECFVSSGPG